MKTKHTMKTKLVVAITAAAPLMAIAHEDPAEHGGQPFFGSNGDEFFRLEPTMHLRLAHGETSLPGADVEFGGHDPDEDTFNFQGFELGASFYLGEHVEGFATVNVFKNDGEEFESEFEEGFAKLINLPGGFELRGGRMLARFGDQNARHLHAWDFANNGLTNVRFLGEDGFAYEGGEVSWLLPTSFEDILSVGFGSAVAHGHGDEEEDEDGHDEEAELARPEDNIIAVRYQARFGSNDFHRFQAGGSFLTGDNGFDKTTDIYGLDFVYTWRENGLESGGQQVRWRSEWMYRDVENDEGGFDDSGFNTALLWQFKEGWEAGVRYEWIDGVSDPELAERYRISPVLTRTLNLGEDLTGTVRLQYDHDDIDDHGRENSIWLQFGFDWGPGEVR